MEHILLSDRFEEGAAVGGYAMCMPRSELEGDGSYGRERTSSYQGPVESAQRDTYRTVFATCDARRASNAALLN